MSEESQQYSRTVIDDGTTHVCFCGKRWGGPLWGPRDIVIGRCEQHKEKVPNPESMIKGFRSYHPHE